jgi:23S rRNA pseudouridine2605 synthase
VSQERLQKVMAQAGVASRRKCEELIVNGHVKVNGVVVRELGTKVDPLTDEIRVDDKPIAKPQNVYVILNKPKGVITTVRDPQDRLTVLDLVGNLQTRVFPVGRLDQDTTGLLLLTNDGELTNRLIHPRYHIDKMYRVLVKGMVPDAGLERLEQGIRLDDGWTAPAEVQLLKRNTRTTLLHLTIHEGRNRQVRRMMDAIGHPVLELERVRMGPLSLGDLPKGAYRHLSEVEVQALYRLAFPERFQS